jgi:hypothetical protein
MFQKLSNSLIPPVEDAQLVSRLVKVSSCFLSIYGVRLFGSGPDHVPACTYCACLGTCQRSSPKTCPFVCQEPLLARSEHQLCMLILERPSSASLGTLLLKSSLSPLLNGSSFSDIGRPMRLVPSLLVTLPF